MARLVYKICPRALWERAEQAGFFQGAPIDITDGYIHLSAAGQVRETAARHFAGQSDLVLLTVDADTLGDALRWEPSRGGELFPHLYGALPCSAVVGVQPLVLDKAGAHVFPAGIP